MEISPEELKVTKKTLKAMSLVQADDQDVVDAKLQLNIKYFLFKPVPNEIGKFLFEFELKNGVDKGTLYGSYFLAVINIDDQTYLYKQKDLLALLHKAWEKKEFCEEPEAGKLLRHKKRILGFIEIDKLVKHSSHVL